MSEHASARPQTTTEKIATFLDIVRRALKARDAGAADSDKLENEARAAAYAAVKLIIKHKVELREPGAVPRPAAAPASAPPNAPYANGVRPRAYASVDDLFQEMFRRAPAARPVPPPPPPSPPRFEGALGKSLHRGTCAVCREMYEAGDPVLVSAEREIAHADCGKAIPATAAQLWESHRAQCFSCGRCPTLPHAHCDEGQAIFRRVHGEARP